ncbi:MAG: response regulator [Bacillota bacterium]
MRVLIADDSLFVRSYLRSIIEEAGHQVAGEAGNGQEALNLYVENKPDIVTMDITMPDVNGLEAIKMIRAHDPNARIVVVSAMGQENIVKEAFALGARGFIAKPFVPARVLQEIETVGRFKK